MIIDLALDSRLFLYNQMDMGLQELDLILNTESTELLCKPNYGSNFYQFLWQMTPSVDEIKSYIRDKINSTYYLRMYQTDIEVNIVGGEIRDIYYVKISVYDFNDHTNVKYREYQFR